jgi:FKBP-type peptidyl-prolyl cis-trans isomerase FklB
MKIKLFAIMTITASIMFASCGSGQLKKLKTDTDSLSYAFGIINYNALTADSIILDPAIIAKAMNDGKKEKALMSDDEARGFIMTYINLREQKRAAAMEEANKVQYKEHIELNENFLAENKKRAGVITTESGLQYEVVKMGNGAIPTMANSVRVHYTGTLIDGTEFDSSVARNEPAEFGVPYVIQGWVEALQLMPVGSKFKLFIPENLAYGANSGGVIPPYSTLIFDVELLAIVQ